MTRWHCLLVAALLAAGAALAAEPDPWADARRAPRGPNLVPNSSFEVGYTQNWGHSNNLGNPGILGQKDATEDVAYHGKRSLRPTADTLRRTSGQKGIDEVFFTRPFKLKSGKAYSFGFYALGPDAKSSTRLEIGLPPKVNPDTSSYIPLVPKTTQTFALSPSEWRRCEVFFHAPAESVHLRFTVPAGMALDAFFLQEVLAAGPSASRAALPDAARPTGDLEELDGRGEKRDGPAWSPTSPVEAGLFSDYPGHIFYREDGVKIPLRLFNGSARPQTVHLAYDIVDAAGRPPRKGKAGPFQLKPGEARLEQLDLGPHGLGKFSIVHFPEGHPQATDEFVYDVIAKPNGKSFCGAHTSALPETGALFQRAGAPWYDTLTDGQFRWYWDWDPQQEPKPDLAAAETVAKYGFTRTLVIEPNRVRFTAPNPDPLPLRHPMPLLDLDLWGRYCGTLARLYRPHMDTFVIGDELEASYHPSEFFPVIKTAAEAIRKEYPQARIAVSATGGFFENLFAMGGDKYVDVLAGSTMGASGIAGRRMGEVARRYGKTVSYLAGFTPPIPFHRTHGGQGGAGDFYRKAVHSFFEQRAVGMTPYVARTQCLSAQCMMNRHNVILWDGSFTAAFTYFLVAGGILGGGDADPDPLDAPGFRTPGMVWPFRQGGPEGRPAVCIGAVERTVTLACPPDKVEARDWLDEPIPVTPASQGRCQVKLPANYSYLYDKGLGRDRFYAVIREAETDDPLPGEEPVQFRAWLRREGQRLSQVVILQGKPAKTAAVPIAPFGATDLTGKPRWRVLASVQPWDPRRPAVPEVLNRSNPVSFWRSPAVRNVSARPDADLGEWLALSRNDIYVTESFLGRYDRKFWHAHKDAFRIATDLGRDFRVYWWAGWNEAGLLLAARVNDDDVRPGPAGDRLDLHVAADWPPAFDPAGKDKGELAALPDPTVRRFAVRLAEGGGLAVLDPEGKAVAGATGAWRRRPDPWGGYDLEMVLPWRDAGVARPAAGVEIGFDLIAWDVDEVAGLPGEAALRWAGGARPLGVLELVP